ncbi:hypothetical protein GRS48_11760 [Halorubrum sp. JWXQ-INN 858]|uniref:hypothetical protein n=1 Tax=Halorubrum sp. JWXQ-INN 858 TaxID=2690782 RepID=UPI001359BC27|nr:hypothetical protein [Halorubrum sp. JWXQ-INN 858]MWV65487.1 hypothetical protein [Halorubrum sp. JWXQ-INN 858]
MLPRGAPRDADEPERASGVGDRIDSIVRGAGRALLNAIPVLERPLQACRGMYAERYVRAVRWRHNRAHRAPIDPFEVYRVDPDAITHVSKPTGLPRFRRAGSVMDGDWDRSRIAFVDADVYRAFEARFQEGRPWEDTAFFDRVVSEIEDGEEPWGCRSRAAFERRCSRLDRLAMSVRDNGFLTQRELAASNVDDPLERARGTLPARILNDEVAVDVGRDGELLYADGRNRLALAKVLDVDTLPVVILRRHVQWVDAREAIAAYVEGGASVPEPYAGHPDLAFVDDSSAE